MSIDRWIPSESNLSTEDALDVLAEKVFELERITADQDGLNVIQGFQINESSTGAFSGSESIQVESTTRKFALGLVRISCTSGDADFDLTISGGRADLRYPLSLQADDDIFEVLPLNYPGNFLLTLNYSGIVNITDFIANIDVWVVSL